MSADGAPAVTVLMPVHNPNARYLREAVESVLAQTLSDFELVIIEDPWNGSAADVLSPLRDARIRIHRNEVQLGLAESLNVGLRMARAPLVARLDADDLCLPRRLETQAAFLNAHPDVAVYGSRITVIDDDGRPIAQRMLPLSHDEIARRMRTANPLSHPSVMFRKAIVEDAGGYERNQVVEDYELWCRLLARGARFAASEEPLILYRFHAGALKFSLVRPTIASTLAIKRRYFRGQLRARERLRVWIERLLLLMPPRLVVWMFKRIEYRGLNAGKDRGY